VPRKKKKIKVTWLGDLRRRKKRCPAIKNIVEDFRSMSFSSFPRTLLLLSLGVALGTSISYFLTIHTSRKIKRENDEMLIMEDIVDGVEGLIGNTKLVRIRSLSIATGCEILAKAEVKNLFPYTSNWVVP
jgi:hypothetical protein